VKLLSLIAVIVPFLAGASLFAQKTDYTQPQSPPRPVPGWVQLIDQGQYDPRLKGYFTPKGLKVEIVADFPTVINPVGIMFGPDGTLYVLEWRRDNDATFPEHMETFTYKDGSKRQVATMKKHVKDVVKVLRHARERDAATPGYNEATVILEEELPSSILIHDGWLYVSGRGTVRRYKQSRPGGAYDVKEIIAQGFCGFHHHQVSGLTIGNDGWLYITSGDDDNYVEGSDGSRATVLRTGAIFRCRPDGSKLHVYSIGYRNPYRDVAFDAAFNMFHADNDNEDGSKFTGCRLMHIAERTDFGWRLKIGARCCVPDHVRGAVFGELPGKSPPMLKTGRGAPAGLLIYNDTYFPEQYRGLLYYPDVFRKLIRAYQVAPVGATFEVKGEFEFLKSDDPLFRPCQMVLGPDGAMYVCDWRTNSGGAGQLSGDGKHGRIYRIRHDGVPLREMDSWAKIGKQSDDELMKALSALDFSDRQVAQRELVRRGSKNRTALLKMLEDGELPVPARIAALGALHSFWDESVRDAFIPLLRSDEPDLRRLAADGLALNCQPGDKKAHAALLEALGEHDPGVKRAIVLAISRIGADGAADNLVNTLAFDDGIDASLRLGLVHAIEGLGAAGINRLVALAESGVDKDRDRAVDALLGMRTRPAAEAIPNMLVDPHLTVAQRANLIRSYTNYLLDPPVSLAPVLDYLSKYPEEALPVRLAGLEVLSAAGALKDAKANSWLLAQLEETDPGMRLAVLKAIEDVRPAKAAPKVAAVLRDAERPAAERTAAAKALRSLGDKSAVPVLKEILQIREATADAATLRLEALRSLAAIDAAEARLVAGSFLDVKDAGVQGESVRIFGADRDGAKQIGKLFLDQKLPRELLPSVADALRSHAARDGDAAKMLAAVMRTGLLVTNTPAEIKRVEKLVKTKGNPRRGRELFLNSTTLACIKCHRLEGVGGVIGPDLTRIWETHTIDKIMESILEPSKEIKEGYQTYEAATKQGKFFSGLKVSQTPEEVVLRDAEGKDVRIAVKDLEVINPTKVSLMPDNAVSQLSYDQFIDLVAFLKNQKTQESLRGMGLEFWVVGPFGDDLRAVYPPEEQPNPDAVYSGAKADEKLKWQRYAVEPSGHLNLWTIFQRDHISAYALTYVFSPQVQKVDLLVGSDDFVRVWIDGELVHEHTTVRTARPDEDRVSVTLKEGWNRVLAKVVNDHGGHGLFLRFGGGSGLRLALKPDAK
jgi:putative membrane-bound dehydrogenase-like protein